MKNAVQVIFEKKPDKEKIPSIQEAVHALGIKQALINIHAEEFNETKWMIEYQFDLEYAVSYLLQSALKYYTICYMNDMKFDALCRGFVEGD